MKFLRFQDVPNNQLMLLLFPLKSHRHLHRGMSPMFDGKDTKDFRQTEEKQEKVCKIAGFLLSFQPNNA